MAAEADDESGHGATALIELHLRFHPHGDWRVDHLTTQARSSGHNLRLALMSLAEKTTGRTPVDLTGSTVVVGFEIPSTRFQTIVDDVWARSCACDELERAVTIVCEDRLQLCTEDLATLLRVTPSEVRDAFASARHGRN